MMLNSKGKIVLVLIFTFVLIGASAFYFFQKVYPKLNENKIKREINKANYCIETSDCQIVQSKCPFDCYAPVNKDEARRIKSIINGFESKCVYSCVQIEGVECISNKCVLKN